MLDAGDPPGRTPHGSRPDRNNDELDLDLEPGPAGPEGRTTAGSRPYSLDDESDLEPEPDDPEGVAAELADLERLDQFDLGELGARGELPAVDEDGLDFSRGGGGAPGDPIAALGAYDDDDDF